MIVSLNYDSFASEYVNYLVSDARIETAISMIARMDLCVLTGTDPHDGVSGWIMGRRLMRW